MLLATVGYDIGPLIISDICADSIPSVPLRQVSRLRARCCYARRDDLAAPLVSTGTLACIAVLGVLCTAVAMLLMFFLVQDAGASRATLITYINPVVATLLGVGLLHERLGVGWWRRLRRHSARLISCYACHGGHLRAASARAISVRSSTLIGQCSSQLLQYASISAPA
ncbi:MAG: DMT family transporter [Steroidobacteraceae bacterium]